MRHLRNRRVIAGIIVVVGYVVGVIPLWVLAFTARDPSGHHNYLGVGVLAFFHFAAAAGVGAYLWDSAS